MASSEERIARMLAAGVVTERQAELLRSSLGGRETASVVTPPPRRAPRWALALGGLAALGALAALLAGGGDPATVQDVAETLNQPGGIGGMNKTLSSALAVFVLAIAPLAVFVWFHNDLVSKEEAVFEAWGQTESTFQRRADLVPALVETVSRYLRHERETLGEVTAARTKPAETLSGDLDALVQAQGEAAELLREQAGQPPEEEGRMEKLAAAERQIALRLRSILATAESYPDLRSADQFLQLQAQLEGTENRINVARMRFNESVRAFNGAIRRLPGNLIARLGDFRRKAYFQADEGSERAPVLDLP